MTDAETIVARLVQAWEARDADAVVACFLPDGVWHNMPYPPLTGRPAIHKAAAGFLATAAALEAVYSDLKAAGSTVGSKVPLYSFARMSELMGFVEVAEFDRRHGRGAD